MAWTVIRLAWTTSPPMKNAGPNVLEFWLDLASPYSCLSALRIGPLAEAAEVRVTYRPFVLGAIFKTLGWTTSPFLVYEAKGRHMWRDIERRAAVHAIAMARPRAFPQNSVAAHRLAILGLEDGWGERFIREAFRAEFVDGADIADPDVLARCVDQAGGEAAEALQQADAPDIRAKLRAQTEHAIALGVFGAPTFAVGGELLWGDDRLEDALSWAQGRHPLQSPSHDRAMAARASHDPAR